MSGETFKALGMWLVTLGCLVAVLIPIAQGRSPDPGVIGVLTIVAGFLFTSRAPPAGS